ncbi:MAG: superoxide dismutase [Propionibacteriaceae bacterium]|nr:superoxide dismutase [Propionibacteriaceae bacterium]
MTYVLPELKYDYSKLEPFISGQILELHHSKHHAGYVSGANTALDKLAEARANLDFGNLPKLEKDLAFHLGGHINHSIFWENMAPDAGGEPEGEIAAALEEFFGTYEGFKAQFSASANSIQGSGWSLLAWDSFGQRLHINQVYDHQANLPAGQCPLLFLDMWEHAFYLQYKNVKGDFVDAWWNVVNWADVAERFAKARVA